jgi:cytidine deaminase
MNSVAALATQLDPERNKKRIVLTGGAFDLFHTGHLEYLKAAKQQGDILIVHVDGDTSVSRKKGNQRPVIAADNRLAIIRALAVVDYALSTNETFYSPGILRALQPDVVVKVRRPSLDSGIIAAQKAAIRTTLPKARVTYIEPSPDISTTTIIQRLLNPWHGVGQSDIAVPDGLLESASNASRSGFSFSGLKIGAALQTGDGRVFSGCNMSNSSPSLALCAERMAIAKAVSEGATSITDLLVFSSAGQPVTPCGLCRQSIHEFSRPEQPTRVYMANPDGIYASDIRRLLPDAFTTPRKTQN